ncbi:MAG: hypothetical protein ABIQ49_14515 [Gemmatimonadales bacterium]
MPRSSCFFQQVRPRGPRRLKRGTAASVIASNTSLARGAYGRLLAIHAVPELSGVAA